ncbi:hypothetical protein [Streptomyces sp. NPDC050287]|uniref:hypothetical protein n=1 Tax=Streptomyces sp. NPDC050287 TaxID=3365608 RepID=UPI00378F2C0A
MRLLRPAPASAAGRSPVGRDPADAYAYRPLTSRSAVEQYVLSHAGTGRQYD